MTHNIVTDNYVADGDEPHFETCARTIGECVCSVIEGTGDNAGVDIAFTAHFGHALTVEVDITGDDEAEDFVWCDTCNVTVWYVESDMSPDA